MSTTTNEGNIKVKIGEYANQQTGKQSPRTLTIGKLMKTVHSDGTVRFWGKMQLHLLHASLYAMAKPYVEKGDTEFSFNIYRDDDRPASSASPAKQAAEDDDDVAF
jgi:hypothetical protein